VGFFPDGFQYTLCGLSTPLERVPKTGKGNTLVDLDAFSGAFALIFLAEMGDKTQLALMALAARNSWKKVFLGGAAAFLLLNLAAVVVGQVLFRWLDPRWVAMGAAALFAVLGFAALFGKAEEPEDEEETPRSRSVFWGTFLLILFAEMGDKTQLATAGLAARDSAPVAIFAGSTLALWAVSLVGVFFGRTVFARLPPLWVKRGSGLLFLLFAALSFYDVMK
jgi:putative Ca2+/H+ antiporter (TMEM165/GDT1 family)